MRDPNPPGCQAVPVAARHAWSEHRTCASAANTTIICDLLERPVCAIHHAAYERAREKHEQYLLAEQWGWL